MIDRPQAPDWEEVPEGWARRDTRIRGWNVEQVVETYMSKLPAIRECVRGPGPLAFATSPALPPGEPSVQEQNTILAFAYALTLASRDSDRVSVLDWGGGLGFFYFLSRAFLPDEVEIEYHCKDVSMLCQAGREAIPEITFWDDEACLAHSYDLVFSSASLQYSEAWMDVFRALARAARKYLFLSRVPVVFTRPSFVVLQRQNTLDTEFLSWVFRRQELLDAAVACGLEFTREFLLGYKPPVTGSPWPDGIRGYLFRSHRFPPTARVESQGLNDR